MFKLLFNFLDDATTTVIEDVDSEVSEVTTTFYEPWQMVIWYGVLALVIILLIVYFSTKSAYYKSFHNAQVRLGKEYTKLTEAKNVVLRLPRTYKVIEKVLSETVIVKDKTSLPECDEAIQSSKDLMERIIKVDASKEKDSEKFIKDVAGLNSKLAQIYSIIKK